MERGAHRRTDAKRRDMREQMETNPGTVIAPECHE